MKKENSQVSNQIGADNIDLPSLAGKNWSAQFDEPEMSSDAGLAAIAASGVGKKLLATIAAAIVDARKNPDHDIAELVNQRVNQIIAGYFDANDCNVLREDVVVRSASEREIEKGALASQPTMSRLENMVTRSDLYRISEAIFDHYLDQFGDNPPPMICIDMDPSAHLTYGTQQLTLFNTHVGDHCLMPFYIFDGCTGQIMTAIIRPGKTPTAGEINAILKRLVKKIRQRWPEIRITFRADSHHTKPQVMDWMNLNKVDFVTGLSKNDALDRLFFDEVNQARSDYSRKCKYRGQDPEQVIVTSYADAEYAAGTWSQPERVVARVIVSSKGVDVRYIVTSFHKAEPKYLYETVYCQRGNAELFIKECKLGLGSDRSSCNRSESNQFRLLLHVAAYTIMHQFRDQVLVGTKWARATFEEIRLRIIKVACRLEIFKTKIKLHLPESLRETLGGVWRSAAAIGAAR